MDEKRPKQGSANQESYNFAYFEKMNEKAAQKQATSRPSSAPGGKPKPGNPQPNAKQAKQGKPASPQGSRPKAPETKKPPQKPADAAPKAPVRSRDFPADPLPKKRAYQSPEELQRQRRRIRALGVLGGSFVAIIIVLILCLTVFFNINHIEVTGASRYNAEQIRQASGISSNQNLFTLNESKIAEQIETKLPYVKSVEITRHLPSGIVIEVSDMVVVGAVQSGDSYIVIGTNGKILERVSSLPEGCPELVGITLTSTEPGKIVALGDEKQSEALQAFSEALDHGVIEKLTKIDLSDLYNLKAIYDQRIILHFGTLSDMEYKFRFLQAILQSGKISDTSKGTMDLSLAGQTDKVYFDPDYSVGDTIEDPDDTDTASNPQTTDRPQNTGNAGDDEDGDTDNADEITFTDEDGDGIPDEWGDSLTDPNADPDGEDYDDYDDGIDWSQYTDEDGDGIPDEWG